MQIEENLFLNDLFDCYGALLSQNQQEILKCYLQFNLTTSEIAENRNISRQAVQDVIVKGQKKLEDYEKKLGLMKRINDLEKQVKTQKGRSK